MGAPAGFEDGPLLAQSPSAVVREVGRGGARFVCKRLPPRLAREHESVEALHREGQILQALAGRGAPRWEASGTDGEGPFLVMEHVPYPTLGSLALALPAPDARRVHRAALASFAALAQLHDAGDQGGPLGVVHGDLSPDNVLLSLAPDGAPDPGDQARLVDLGLARWRGGGPGEGGALRGTLLYLAPEVARGLAPDVRADLFALAAALLHGASGRPPRRSITTAALLLEAGERSLKGYVGAVADTLDRRLGEVLGRCLADDPAQRPGRAADVVAELW